MAQFFIDRPVFAWVIAILISLGGVLAVRTLPAEAYPDVAPPQVSISAVYPGANADTVERTVIQVIEQQLTGIDNLMYFSSNSSNSAGGITLVFETGTDPDVAAVQTQNRVALAEPRLPRDVVLQGLTVAKVNSGFLMAVSLRSKDNSVPSDVLNNIVAGQVLDPISRIPGVGQTQQFGAEYSMRIWLNPDKLRGFRISAAEVADKIRGQNVQFATGALGEQPATEGQQVVAPVSAEGQFSSKEEFENIILRSEANGTSVRLKDVARVQLGLSSYSFDVRLDNQPVAGFGVLLSPGANALDVADQVRTRMNALAPSFPHGVEWFLPFDATVFINAAIHEVVVTLVIAVVLVFIVMLVFLQSFRATIIPTLVVPVALMGAFIGMAVFGFSINQLTLFGMVLAIGIVVDDAIVVIESVERIMREEHLPPKEATRKAMTQITNPIIAISVVLAAVFIPSALQSGSVGMIYQQFAMTIAISMAFSAFLALSLTPALCATILRPEHLKENRFFALFNRSYDRTQQSYLRAVKYSLRHQRFWLAGFVALLVAGVVVFRLVPSSFVPEEDQGFTIGMVMMPPGTSQPRTREFMRSVSEQVRQVDGIHSVFEVTGFSFIGNGESVGMFFIKLKDYGDRSVTAADINGQLQGIGFSQKDGMALFFNFPTIPGLGEFGGFDFWLEDRAGAGRGALYGAMGAMLGKGTNNPNLSGLQPNELPPAPQLNIKVDRTQAESMGLNVSDVYSAAQLMLAPVYVNDFIFEGRVLRVTMQADAPFRMNEDAFQRFYLPAGTNSETNRFMYAGDNANDGMVPLSAVVQSSWSVAPPSQARFNGFPAVNIKGNPGPGKSSGQAMDEMERITREDLPPGFGFDWAGQSFQERLSGEGAPMLFALSLLVVFLCLAALYESWATPIAVLLVVPVGLIGSVFAAAIAGMSNDLFFKVGLITIIGLAAKNAILIVEFALEEQKRGTPLYESVLEAARLRLRPILMTSFAFILGVLPLVFATGAGANARRALGTGVVGGMLSAAILGVLLAPIFYVVIRRMAGDKLNLNEG
ncbi:MAG: multidrug efflux transporter permease subunit [Steroidobacteraceae bacterium]|jgi:multidrug efflux pump|nr:multidrug efflux transporter permease subunit [Steroidobacteraceae bacterium]